MEISLNTDAGDVISIFMRRTKEGIQLDVRTTPEVEEFFQRWGGKRLEDARAIGGRLWRTEGNQPLMVWLTNGAVNSRAYLLNAPGTPLISEDDGETPNISFLQIEGVSQGKTFVCDMVMSRQEMDRMRGRIANACAAFYNDYIKPANMQVVVSAKQVGV